MPRIREKLKPPQTSVALRLRVWVESDKFNFRIIMPRKRCNVPDSTTDFKNAHSGPEPFLNKTVIHLPIIGAIANEPGTGCFNQGRHLDKLPSAG
jgi:hypothetical protein